MTKYYGRRAAVLDCTLNVSRGEVVGLVGENGSGKSTLIRCLLGFTPPTRGSSWICPSVGYCPQDNYLNRGLTVSEHFRLLMELYRSWHRFDQSFLGNLLDQMKLTDLTGMQIGRLSSGTYQKVKFISSVFHRPDLLVLDEPTDGFDWGMYLQFWRIMEEVKRWNGAVIIVSHFLYDRDRFSRILEMDNGRCNQT